MRTKASFPALRVSRSAFRALPPYISLHHTGAYDVRIKRNGVEYRARVPRNYQFPSQLPSSEGPGVGSPRRFPSSEGSGVGSPNPALARAMQLVAQFLKLAGGSRTSNTGITGITETTHWTHNHAYPAFVVCGAGHHRARFLCHRYGGRRQALRAAAAHRARLTGERITSTQIEEALCHV